MSGYPPLRPYPHRCASGPATPTPKARSTGSASGSITPGPHYQYDSLLAVPIAEHGNYKSSSDGSTPSPSVLYLSPQRTGAASPQSPLISIAYSDQSPDGNSKSSTPVPVQSAGSLAVPVGEADSPPIPLMKDRYPSSDSISSMSICSDETGSDFVRVKSRSYISHSTPGVLETPRSDPGPIIDKVPIEVSGRDLLASCSGLPWIPPPSHPRYTGLKLAINTNIDKDFIGDPDPSFRRAASSPGGPVREAFVEQVGSAFSIKNLRNDSLGALPRITALEYPTSEPPSPELKGVAGPPLIGCKNRGPEIAASGSIRTTRPEYSSTVILPGESDRRRHSHSNAQSRGGIDIGSAASIIPQSLGRISPTHAYLPGNAKDVGPERPPVTPETQYKIAVPEAVLVRAASEEFSLSSLAFPSPMRARGSFAQERKPFPPGQGGASAHGIYPAPPIKTTVLCYANVLPEQPRVPTPASLPEDTHSRDTSSEGSGVTSVRYARVRAPSPLPSAASFIPKPGDSTGLRSVKALLLKETIQLKVHDHERSGSEVSREIPAFAHKTKVSGMGK